MRDGEGMVRGKLKTDAIGRKQPSQYMRRKRALTAAQHRWKEKRTLEPGISLHWSQRSFANKLRHLAAVKKGGATTGGQIREQHRLFWRWYHGDCKAQLRGPFKAVIETFERIEAAFNQRYKVTQDKDVAWDGFMAVVLKWYVFTSCTRMNPRTIERDLWDLYERFMEADAYALYRDGGLLKTLHDYEDAKEEKALRMAIYRSRANEGAVRNIKKSK